MNTPFEEFEFLGTLIEDFVINLGYEVKRGNLLVMDSITIDGQVKKYPEIEYIVFGEKDGLRVPFSVIQSKKKLYKRLNFLDFTFEEEYDFSKEIEKDNEAFSEMWREIRKNVAKEMKEKRRKNNISTS